MKVRWVDTDKGDRHRSRLCAMEFRRKAEATWFAGTPPLESLKILAVLLATRRRTPRGPICMKVLDVKRAHFHAPATREIYVELPSEDAMESDPATCGELVMSMYGTRDAAYNWERAYSQVLATHGFVRGQASPCHFFDAGREIRLMVHGDDFVAVGPEQALEEFEEEMRSVYPCVSTTIGPSAQHAKRVKVIGRWVELTTDGVEIMPDPKYVEQALAAYGLQDCKPLASPAVREKDESAEDRRQILVRRLLHKKSPLGGKDKEEEEVSRGEPLDEAAATTFRSVAALINFVAPDRADIQYSNKEILRGMAQPGSGDLNRLKRELRYLKGRLQIAIMIP